MARRTAARYRADFSFGKMRPFRVIARALALARASREAFREGLRLHLSAAYL